MKKLKIGIIGAGGIATGRHIPSFRHFSDQAEIAAVSDINIHRAEDVAKEYEIPKFFGDYTDMLPEVDAVVVCTPNKYHAEISTKALEAGVHVLCEKPMALSAEECRGMIETARKNERKLAIAYHYRYMKESQAAKKVMITEEIGTPLVVRIKALRRRKVPGWGVFTNKELQGGGSLIDYGCHLLDLALWLIGNPEIKDVTGSTYNALSKVPNQVNLWGHYDHQKFNVDDHVTAYIRFKNGTSLLFETSWATNIRDDEEHLSISGVNGGISVFPMELFTTKYNMLFNSQPAWIPGEEDPGILQAKNFIAACFNEEELIVKPEEAMQVSEIIDAIYESSRITVQE